LRAEQRIASALGLPRVGAVALLEGAGGAEKLVEYAREHVRAVGVPWLDEAREGKWLGLRSEVLEVGA
ncbi:hypothetical protein LTS18_013288, partial [Coniosporium uncinatum]